MKFNYSWGNTRNDLLAGVTVAAISLSTSHGLRSDRGCRPALWAIFRHCDHARSLDLWFVLRQAEFLGAGQQPLYYLV
jgi:hypothetical protein